MEHLFFHPSEERMRIESHSAVLSDFYERDWVKLATHTDLVPHVTPTTRWLGFKHQMHRDEEWIPLQRDLNLYPVVRGWSIFQAWDRGDLRKSHPSLEDESLSPTIVGECFSAMIQSWLYFGLLEAVTGKWLDVSYLVRPDETGRIVLYSRNLCFALYAWTRRLQELDAEPRAAELKIAYNALMTTATCIQQLLLWSDPTTEPGQWTKANFPGYIERIYEIAPAIVRLTDVIGATRDRLAGEADIRVIGISGLPASQEKRNARLRGRGWCPYLLACCSRDMYESVVDWLDASGKVNPLGRHEGCSEEACIGNNIDISRYKMQHCTRDCRCASVRPLIKDVTSAIERDLIPVIRLVTGLRGVELKVDDCSPDDGVEYIVFSHVWADGLGSTTEKGIYECQALRLAAIAEKVKPGRAWWIDSLCVPYASPYRYLAIRQLRKVYSRATRAVVIDKSMTQCQSGDAAENILWSIVSSSWMQRLWTYQEAFLPEHMDILFDDSLFTLEPSELPRSALPPVIQVVWTNLFDHVASVRPNLTQRIMGRKTNLGEVLTAINWRTTSRRSGETLAAAALLSIDPWSLPENDETPELRMEKLLLLVHNMPDDIIFFTGPKMRRQPFRWAPSTLMARSYTSVDSSNDHQRAICTPRRTPRPTTLPITHTRPDRLQRCAILDPRPFHKRDLQSLLGPRIEEPPRRRLQRRHRPTHRRRSVFAT